MTVLVVTVLVLVVVAAVAELGERVIDRRRAQSAADAAALVGVAGGEAAARELALANGATLQGFARDGDEVVVVVTLDSVSASARARTEP